MSTWYLQFDFDRCGSGTVAQLYYGINSFVTLHTAGTIQIPCSVPDKEAYVRDYLIEYLTNRGLTAEDMIYVNGFLYYQAPEQANSNFLLYLL